MPIGYAKEKKWNRESRERTRKEDEEFKEKVTEVGTGGSPDPLFRRMAVRMSCKGIAE
jgi:hypothetical protein